MQTTLTIGQLSKESGLPAKTIRFYEEIGLIAKPGRAENGYRTYPASRIEELILIKSARELGLPIPRIKKLMVGCPDGDCSHSGEYIDREIGEYISDLDTQIQELSHIRTRLLSLRKNFLDCTGNHDGTYCCNVLGQIAQLSKGGEKE